MVRWRVDWMILTGSGNNGETCLWQRDDGCRGQDAKISAKGQLEAASEG
jgi:hypothetical protein